MFKRLNMNQVDLTSYIHGTKPLEHLCSLFPLALCHAVRGHCWIALGPKKKKSPFITTSAAQQAGRRAGSATDGLAEASYYRSPWFPHSLTDEPLACHQPLHSLSISQTLPGVTGRHWVADSESN